MRSHTNDRVQAGTEMLVIDATPPITPADQRTLVGAFQNCRGYANMALLRKDKVRRDSFCRKRPAMSQWCMDIIDRDANTTLPRGISRQLSPRPNKITNTEVGK